MYKWCCYDVSLSFFVKLHGNIIIIIILFNFSSGYIYMNSILSYWYAMCAYVRDFLF